MGQVYLAGVTESEDFPLRNAFQPIHGGSEDAFALKLTAGGGELVYSTYLGGKDKDAGLAIALDGWGGVTVAGRTTSKEALPTRKALQTELQGGVDILIARFDSTGNAVFSSYLGGEKDDIGEDIALNPSGEAYLVGSSRSSDALPLIDPLQPLSGGGSDAYVARIYINGAPQFLSWPLTEAVEDTLYRYPVEAEDPDGDPLSFALLAAPSGMAIDPDSGLIHWPVPRIGVHPVRIRLFDDMGAYADQQYDLTVIPNNRPPEILSQPIIAAVVDRPYQYAVKAVDPDGDPLRFRLNGAPLGMQIDPAGGLIEWRPVASGDYPVEMEVSDNNATSALQSFTVTVTYDPDNLPPVFESPGDQAVALGSTLNLQLIAQDPENRPLTYSVAPLPLPQGANLDTTTGLFTFKPGLVQAGEWVFTFAVSDGRHSVKQTITVTVPAADPAAPTRMIGRVVDATALARGLDLPVVGATVSFLGTGAQTVTDGHGDFVLSGVPEGVHVFSIDSGTADPAPGGAAYASFRVEMPLIAHSDNLISRPFSLPRIDTGSQTQINPVQAAVVSNPAIGVSLSIPANTALNADGSQFTGQLSISQVPPPGLPERPPHQLPPRRRSRRLHRTGQRLRQLHAQSRRQLHPPGKRRRQNAF